MPDSLSVFHLCNNQRSHSVPLFYLSGSLNQQENTKPLGTKLSNHENYQQHEKNNYSAHSGDPVFWFYKAPGSRPGYALFPAFGYNATVCFLNYNKGRELV